MEIRISFTRKRWAKRLRQGLDFVTTFALGLHEAAPGHCDRCDLLATEALGGLRNCAGWLMCSDCRHQAMDYRGWPCPTCPDEEHPKWRKGETKKSLREWWRVQRLPAPERLAHWQQVYGDE